MCGGPSRPYCKGLELSSPWWQRLSNGRGSSGITGTLKTLLTVSLLILALNGCAASRSNVAPPPPRPTLESLEPTPEGGICMDKQDAAELLLYLDSLERRVGGAK